VLLYRMIFNRIGYEGRHTEYDKPGWPLSERSYQVVVDPCARGASAGDGIIPRCRRPRVLATAFAALVSALALRRALPRAGVTRHTSLHARQES
jgi:hypothetical protein